MKRADTAGALLFVISGTSTSDVVAACLTKTSRRFFPDVIPEGVLDGVRYRIQ